MTIQRTMVLGLLIVGLGAPRLAAQAPAGATGKCKDGSYTTVKTKSSACTKHGGLAQWTGATPATAHPASAAAPTPAQPSTAPAGATAKCKDGTYTTVKTKSDACMKHGGVAKWMGAPAPAAHPAASAAPASAPAPAASALTNPAPAQPAAAAAPAGATAQCKDGTYSTNKHVSGTCDHHGGVGKWINKPKL